MAKLTKTQINAIVGKLQKEAYASIDENVEDDITVEQRKVKENEDYLRNLILKATNMPMSVRKAIVKSLLAGWHDSAELYMDEPFSVQKAMKLPHVDIWGDKSPDHESKQARKKQVDNLLEDLQFELVMAGQDDYSEFMDDFRAKVAKLVA